jgi:hypothetical protein
VSFCDLVLKNMELTVEKAPDVYLCKSPIIGVDMFTVVVGWVDVVTTQH